MSLSAYHVPDASGMIKLDAMENPYPWPGELKALWLEALSGSVLNRYPDPDAAALKADLRRVMAIPENCDILLGNGSDELIQMIAMALSGPTRVVLAPQPSFSMYRIIATSAGLGYVGVPLRSSDFALDRDALLQAIDQYQPAVVFLAFPNNPTANLFDEDSIRAVIRKSAGLVVIDEAYHGFAGRSLLDLTGEFDNLLILRTLSKVGLAGLRLGYLVGPTEWLAQFNKIRLPYNIGILTQASARFALEHYASLDRQLQRVVTERELLLDHLRGMKGVTPFPSQTNFILIRTLTGRATEIFETLKANRVLIKNLHGSDPMLHDCLRVTVGTAEENAAFLKALSAAL